VLLQRRAAIKDSWPNRWDISSAGHVSAGEAAAPTAQREVEEELGVSLPAARFEHLHTHLERLASTQRGKPFVNNEFNDIFLVAASPEERRTWVSPTREPAASVLKLQEIEVSDVKWVPWRAVVDLYTRSHADATVTPSALPPAELAAMGLEADDCIVPASDFASAGRVFDVIRDRSSA
jgi:isopentenyldiphosphate isomerase